MKNCEFLRRVMGTYLYEIADDQEEVKRRNIFRGDDVFKKG